MAHANQDAALPYQHATEDHDRVIAEALARMARPAPAVDDVARESEAKPG